MASLFLKCPISLAVGMENYVPLFNTLHSLAEGSAVVRMGKLWGVHKLLAQFSKFSKRFRNTAKRKTIRMHYFDTKVIILTDAVRDYKMFYRRCFSLYSYRKILNKYIILSENVLYKVVICYRLIEAVLQCYFVEHNSNSSIFKHLAF
jgi:hypothetical protein